MFPCVFHDEDGATVPDFMWDVGVKDVIMFCVP